MKLHFLLTLGCFSASTLGIVMAESDAVRQAIERFEKSRREKKAPEVTVVLEPPAEVPPSVPVEEPPLRPAPEPEQDPAPAEAPPPTREAIEIPREPAPIAPPTSPAPEPTPNILPPTPHSERGVSLSVDQLSSGDGPLDPSSLKIHAPFPAKPLAQAPPGWRIVPSKEISPFAEKVELEKGKPIELSIKPHILTPEADGFLTFSVTEPGFDPSLEYHQNATVGAVLSRSLLQLDEDSKQLGNALDQLEQILFSLPQPRAKAVIVEEQNQAPGPNTPSSP